jgi:hypothetical protein
MKLRVWWIPQIPMPPFHVEVATVQEGVKVMDVLSAYDLFQYENNVKGDYANAGGLEMFENGEWMTWWDEETDCDDPREYLESLE